MSPSGLGLENALARTSSIVNDRSTLSLEMMLQKDLSWKIKLLVVSLKGLVVKTN
jgi:hypothetical protein